MIEKERQVLIMEQIRANGFVSVKDLMMRLEASRSSIMRDLQTLEGQGLLKRERGGACLPEVTETLSRKKEPAVKQKENVNAEGKRRIARKAAELAEDGFCIFMDSGTTVPYLLPYLRDREVTIVTPSVHLIRHLPEDMTGSVFLLGGQYDAKYEMLGGSCPAAMLEMYRFDLAFMSANGADLNSGEVMVADFGLAALKQSAMKRSAKRVLLIDRTKLNRRAACTYARLQEFDTVFIDTCGSKKLPGNFIPVKE